MRLTAISIAMMIFILPFFLSCSKTPNDLAYMKTAFEEEFKNNNLTLGESDDDENIILAAASFTNCLTLLDDMDERKDVNQYLIENFKEYFYKLNYQWRDKLTSTGSENFTAIFEMINKYDNFSTEKVRENLYSAICIDFKRIITNSNKKKKLTHDDFIGLIAGRYVINKAVEKKNITNIELCGKNIREFGREYIRIIGKLPYVSDNKLRQGSWNLENVKSFYSDNEKSSQPKIWKKTQVEYKGDVQINSYYFIYGGVKMTYTEEINTSGSIIRWYLSS